MTVCPKRQGNRVPDAPSSLGDDCPRRTEPAGALGRRAAGTPFTSATSNSLNCWTPWPRDDYAKPCWHPRGDTTVADFVDLVVNETGHPRLGCALPLGRRLSHGPKMLYPLASTSAAMCWLAWHGLSRECWAPIRFGFELTDVGSMPDLVIGGGRSGVNANPAHRRRDTHSDGLRARQYGRCHIVRPPEGLRRRALGPRFGQPSHWGVSCQPETGQAKSPRPAPAPAHRLRRSLRTCG